jgi:hypothetical protein
MHLPVACAQGVESAVDFSGGDDGLFVLPFGGVLDEPCGWSKGRRQGREHADPVAGCYGDFGHWGVDA